MKRMFAIVSVLAAMLALTSCGACDHVATGVYNGNLQNHWITCAECDGRIDEAAHTLEDSYCAICKLGVIDYEDGSYGILMYDEQGTLSGQFDYNADGTVISSAEYVNEYYEDGNTKSVKEYYDGVLSSEQYFTRSEMVDDAGVYLSEEISYDESGCKYVSLYDEHSLMLSFTEYDASGNAVNADVYEYIRDEAGHLQKQICRSNGVLSNKAEYALDAYGNEYVARDVYYDANGNIISEMRYDENGYVVTE